MELIKVTEEMHRATKRISNCPKEIEDRARDKAQAEYEYRKALSQAILKYKAEGYPATLISDLARGEVAELKLERDLKDGLYKSSIEGTRALQSQLNGLQSVARYQSDIGG